MKITQWSLLTGTLFLALTMSGGAWAQNRHIINADAEFGWRVEDNKKATTGAGTAAVLRDDQLQSIVPGNAVNVDTRSFDASQPMAGRLGSSIGTNLVGTPGVGVTNAIDVRSMNVAPAINIPALPAIPALLSLPVIK